MSPVPTPALRRPMLLAGLLVGLLLVAPPLRAQSEDPTTSRPPIILLGLDTLRADHLGCYGNDWISTPHLDRFAESAVLFEDCASTSSWTLPAFASLFTGLLPQRHHAVGGPNRTLAPWVPTLAEALQVQGYRTRGLVAVDYLTEHFGMDRGFTQIESFVMGKVTGRLEHYQSKVFSHVASPPPAPWFLFVHYFDAHDPYLAPSPYHQMYYDGNRHLEPEDPAHSAEVLYSDRNRISQDPRQRYKWLRGVKDLRFAEKEYASGVSYLDHHVGAVLDSLEHHGRFEDSIVVVVGDHGEHLTEHDVYFTHRFPYAECLQVPLMIRLPGGVEGGRRVEDPVSLVDVLPTLLELVGLPHEFPTDGVSLVGAMRGEELAERALFAEFGGRPHNKVKAVWDDEFRLLEFNLKGRRWVELYDRRQDPRETTDLAAERPEKVEELTALLDLRFGPERRVLWEGEPDESELDPEVEARLRALGYIDGR